jgi:hypothetical protein
MLISKVRIRVKHKKEIDSEYLNSKIEPFQHLFKERVIRSASAFLSNEEEKYFLVVNKNYVEFDVSNWENLIT